MRILIQQLSFDFEIFDMYKLNIIKLSSLPKVSSSLANWIVLTNLYYSREREREPKFEPKLKIWIIQHNKANSFGNFQKNLKKFNLCQSCQCTTVATLINKGCATLWPCHIYIKMYLNAKEEWWKFKIFHHAKKKIFKKILQRKPKSFKIS